MSEDRIDVIERYLTGKMSSEEEVKFVEAIKNDPELQKEIDSIRLIDEALELSIENSLRQELQTLESANSKTATGTVRRMRLWAIAASLLVIVVAGTVLFRQSNSSLDTFTSEYYVAYNYGQVRGTDASNSPLSPGIELIDNQSLPEALSWFEEYTLTNPDNIEAKFILADIQTQTGNIQAAKSLFGSIIESKSVLWSEKAEWNYVLVSAFANWDDQAESLLNKISTQQSHSYYPAARKLLELRNRE